MNVNIRNCSFKRKDFFQILEGITATNLQAFELKLGRKLFDMGRKFLFDERNAVVSDDRAFKNIDPSFKSILDAGNKFYGELTSRIDQENVGQIKLPESKYKILNYRWHCPHQYEIHKMGHEVHMIKGLGTGFTNHWEFGQRPLLRNAHFIDREKVNPLDYDLSLIHI